MNNGVVVPLDGSKNAENAVPFAAMVAARYQSPVAFVHVVDHEGIEDERALEVATEAFDQYVKGLAEQWGITACTAVVFRSANAAEAILQAAAGARMIVIASHGRGGFHATFIGSVADKVIRGATLPVLLVPGIGTPARPDTTRPVLIALDGSEAAEKALDAGRDLASTLSSPILLLRAWNLATPGMASAPPYGFGYYPAAEIVDSLKAAAEEYLRKVAKAGEEAVTVNGPALFAIVDAATRFDAGVVAVASSGKGMAARVALGSTTDRLMHSLHRPLLIVRE